MNSKQLVHFFNSMSAVNRFSQFRLVNPESVLEHTGMVAIMTMFICDYIPLPEGVELAAIRHALCHDMDEILTGDIPMPTKYSSQKMKDMIDEVAKENMKKISITNEIYVCEDWHGEDGTREIVKMADVIAVFYKAYQEIELFGNVTMDGAITLLPDALYRSAAALKAKHEKVNEHLFDMIDEMIDWAIERTAR